jgi:branched-chain amino acid transport system substrate-binding protein
VVACVVLLAGCASAGGRSDGPWSDPTPGAAGDSLSAARDLDASGTAIADSARFLVEARRWFGAGELADSVLAGSAAGERLADPDALAMATLLRHLGEEDRGARLLLDHPATLESGQGIAELRATVAGMSLAELGSLHRSLATVRVPAEAEGVATAGYALALALSGDAGNAERVARTASQEDLAPDDRRILREVSDGDIQPLTGPVKVGAILSLTGRFAAVGESLRDGIQLAVIERNATAGPGEQVELIIRDDRSEPETTVELIAELESSGVAAVIGPIRSGALLDAAGSRASAALTVVSPTAALDSATGPHAFSLWERSRRSRAIGEALGQWLPERLGLYRLAALYPDSESGREGYLAFESAALASGASIEAAVSYQPDSTTFQIPIETAAESDPEAVLVLADEPGTVLQIGPQLSYFGLRSRVIAGGETWSDPAVLRRLDPAFSDYRVVAAFQDRSAPETAWTRYVSAFESEYRRPVPDNLLPALAYDATRVVLTGITRDALGRPGAVSRAILDAGYLDGATGRIRWTRDGLPAREVDVRMILDRRLVEVDPEAISIWAEEAREREELMKELEEQEEKQKAARESGRQ